jgi:hypothetical protein
MPERAAEHRLGAALHPVGEGREVRRLEQRARDEPGDQCVAVRVLEDAALEVDEVE